MLWSNLMNHTNVTTTELCPGDQSSALGAYVCWRDAPCVSAPPTQTWPSNITSNVTWTCRPLCDCPWFGECDDEPVAGVGYCTPTPTAAIVFALLVVLLLACVIFVMVRCCRFLPRPVNHETSHDDETHDWEVSEITLDN